MKETIDLTTLEWNLAGSTPHLWRLGKSMETGVISSPVTPVVSVSVPGSVQKALLDAGIIADWNVGLNARACEWVENLHWVYETVLPPLELAAGRSVRLQALGLDYCGTILVNSAEAGRFEGSFVPHEFDITSYLTGQNDRLSLVFECPPRWLGQFGHTSEMREWKPRFHYTWDWTSRLVQTGIWDDIFLQIAENTVFGELYCVTEVDMGQKTGSLTLRGTCTGEDGDSIRVCLMQAEHTIKTENFTLAAFEEGIVWNDLPVLLWQPNGQGEQPLYALRCELLSHEGHVLDRHEKRVGFRSVTWRSNRNAPAAADPWVCEVNGHALFLQGVNWTPIRPNFADVTDDNYRALLTQYRELGCNLLRVWGGGFLEKEIFYDLCDELGLFVWQEFPLSSSGICNWPPEDEGSINDMWGIARSYIVRRRHHVSLLLWCGGNELQGTLDGGKRGVGKPIDITHPMMARLQTLTEAEDPTRRFLATSASGPRFTASPEDFGKGLHWDVHGPWGVQGNLDTEWLAYWRGDDSLFRSEAGAPGTSDADIIHAYAGDLNVVPGTADSPLWQRTSWWIEWHVFVDEMGREPCDLAEYVAWSQQRQAQALEIAVRLSKERFPECGGILLWMGHDSFPCTANTSIIDFWGRPKPAALAVGKIFCSRSGANENSRIIN